MLTFILSLALLIVGYFVYGRFVEKVFGINEGRKTPAYSLSDGVDYVPMDWKKNSLIQLLNIAGLGPIFGPILGALWGPVAFVWIVIGGIFAGAVHDYFSGMISVRNNGAQLPVIVRKYLGKGMGYFVNLFSIVLLILVGTVFVKGPADLLTKILPSWVPYIGILAVIFIYYIIATLLPIDKIIGRLYPILGAILLFMAIGVGAMLIIKGYQIPELTFANLHPKQLPTWPLLFITIACGAISGFHATQSPLVARTMQNEKHGRKIFYGMMIGESIIALIWAAAGMALYNGVDGLQEALKQFGGAAGVVHNISITLLGTFGGVLAILGVVVLPITSGDTAFRGARLVVSDFLKLSQIKMKNRLFISIPLFAIALYLLQIDFNFIWRYFAWANQTTAMIMLWTATAYLIRHNKIHWITSIPATFMTAVTTTYILQAPEGFKLPISISYPLGLAITAVIVIFFILSMNKMKKLQLNGQLPQEI